MLSKEEIDYYQRQISLSDFGINSQTILKQASILVIGAGGLGCPALQYLAAAGVGTIGIADFDKVSISNLHRQTIYTFSDVGKYKTDCAKKFLQNLNPHINIDTYRTIVSDENILALIEPYDLVLDCTDINFVKYLINDACVHLGKPWIYGSVYKNEGNICFFDNTLSDTTLRCLFPETDDNLPSCSEVGTLGIVPGITGMLMAQQAIHFFTKSQLVLQNELLIFNASDFSISKIKFESSWDGRKQSFLRFSKNAPTYIITPSDLKNKLSQIQLIDVRSYEEREKSSLGGIHIPLDELNERLDEIDTNAEIVVYCAHGIRSKNAVDFLKNEGFRNIKSLEGGLHLWNLEYGNANF